MSGSAFSGISLVTFFIQRLQTFFIFVTFFTFFNVFYYFLNVFYIYAPGEVTFSAFCIGATAMTQIKTGAPGRDVKVSETKLSGLDDTFLVSVSQ